MPRAMCLLILLISPPCFGAMQGPGHGSGSRLPDNVLVTGRAADVSYLSADLLLRYRASQRLDLDFSMYLYNYSEYDSGAQSINDSGTGDVRFGLRYLLLHRNDGPWLTLRGGVTLPVGDDAYTVEEETLDAGFRLAWPLGASQVAGLGVSGSYNDNRQSTYTSATWSVLAERTEFRLELGRYGGDIGGTIAGGGIGHPITSSATFDVYAMGGIDDEAPDLQAGIGLTIEFD